MIRPDFILSKLPKYDGNVNVIEEDQDVKDIIKGVNQVHKRYAPDYDRIAKYFIGKTADDTCENIFNFLRRSSFYFVESDRLQTLRSPSAILSTGRVMGIDCKNYALFIAGILDAINRTGEQYIPYCYRFASDKIFDPTPNHVYIIAFPGTDNDLWIDPIPQVLYFNHRLTYYYHTDKNFKGMSLAILSGRSNSQMAGGAFGIGEVKLREQMEQFIQEYAPAFLYMYIPQGDGWANEYGWNQGQTPPGIPAVVIQKAKKARETAWDWGMPTGLDTVTQIFPKIRNAIVQRIGMQPEEYWNRIFGTNWTRGSAVGTVTIPNIQTTGNAPQSSGIGVQLLNNIVPYLGIATGILGSFVPDLTFTYRPEDFQFSPSDWTGTQWADKFVVGTDYNNGNPVPMVKRDNTLLYVVGAVVVAKLLKVF